MQGLGEALRDQGHTIASVQWFILQNKEVSYGDPQGLYTQPGGNCQRRGDDADAILSGEPVDSAGEPVTVPNVPDLLALYCDDLDAAGHATGDDSFQIEEALRRVDAQVGRVVEATKRAGTYDQTAFLLVGDHGMIPTTRSTVRSPKRPSMLSDTRPSGSAAGDAPAPAPTSSSPAAG